MPVMIEPMIPGRAAAALPASLPRSLARAFSLFLNHSLTLFGCFGGVVEPPPPPPVNEVMIVEMTSPNAVNTTVIVRPCSLKIFVTLLMTILCMFVDLHFLKFFSELIVKLRYC